MATTASSTDDEGRHIAIIDWRTAPQGDEDSTVEKRVIAQELEEDGPTDIRITRHLCDTEEDMDDDLLAADAIIVWHNMPLSAKGINKLSKCRAIIRNGVGFDSVDIAAARERGIAVCNVPDYGTEEVADHAIALALALCRQLFPLDREAKSLGWNIDPTHVGPRLRRLRELTFGVLGLGRIGTATALRAKALGFGRVLFFDPYLPSGVEKALGISRCRSLETLLQQSDVLSIHCPLGDSTRHLIAERELEMMKTTAFIVNTARGAIIKKTAILTALREGRIAGAGLDVVEDEPLRSEEEARTPNLIATCHSAFCSVEAKIEMRSTSARIAVEAVLGRKLENVVNGVESPRRRTRCRSSATSR